MGWRFLADQPEGEVWLVGRPEWLESVFGPAEGLAGCIAGRVEVRSEADLAPLVSELAERREIFADTESSGERSGDGLDPVSRTSRIVLLQLAVEGRAWLLDPELTVWLRPVLERGPWKIFQNAKHDMAFLMAKYGILAWPAGCTMLAEQILQSSGVSLKHLARRYPPHRVLDKRAVRLFIDWQGRMSPDMIRYAAMDVLVLPDIWKWQRRRLAREQLLGIALLEFHNLPVAVEMTLRGVWLDRQRHQAMVEFHSRRLEELGRRVMEEYRRHRRVEPPADLFGPVEPQFNLRAPEDKKRMLADCGIQVDSTSAEELEMSGHPVAQALVEFMAAAKIVDTYGARLAARVHPDTGRIHPKFDQLGAGERAEDGSGHRNETIATGRWSSDFQQLPRPEYFYEPVGDDSAREVLRRLGQLPDEEQGGV